MKYGEILHTLGYITHHQVTTSGGGGPARSTSGGTWRRNLSPGSGCVKVGEKVQTWWIIIYILQGIHRHKHKDNIYTNVYIYIYVCVLIYIYIYIYLFIYCMCIWWHALIIYVHVCIIMLFYVLIAFTRGWVVCAPSLRQLLGNGSRMPGEDIW